MSIPGWLLVLIIALSAAIGYFLGFAFSHKTGGTIQFYTKQYDEENEVLECMVHPENGNWERIIKQRDILFRVQKSPDVERIIQ